MPNRRTSSLVAVLSGTVLASACGAFGPQSDVGDDWLVGPSTVAISWMGWSPDGTTLYWIAGREPQTLYGATMGTRSPVVMTTGVWSYPSPTLTAGGSALFYMAPDPGGQGGALLEATITGGGTALTGAHTVAGDVFSYRPAEDGTRVALVSASTGEVTIRDLAAGASLALGRSPDPTTFSPDGRVLLARNAATGDAAEHYLLIDTGTGAQANLPFPINQSIELVLDWANGRPRRVIANAQIVDLQDGSTHPLAGIGRIDALSSRADRRFAYGWGDVDCLDAHNVPEVGQVCSAFFHRYSRDDVSDGSRVVIAAEVVDRDDNVDTALPSPDGEWLAVAEGSGRLVGDGPTAIKLKRLAPP